MAKDDFSSTRRSVLYVAIIAALVTLFALVMLEVFKDDLWAWLYAAGTNVAAVIFGLAVVSLFWEFLVRREHSTELRHYLRLGASVAKSGLQEVATRSELDWRKLLQSANEVTVLTHSADWLERNLYVLRDVAKGRVLDVTIAVPSASGTYLSHSASVRGIPIEKLNSTISESVTRAAGLWRDAKDSTPPSLHSGSRLSVVEHEIDLGYDVITIDGLTIVTLAAPGDTTELQDRLVFVYEQNPAEYPTSFFRAYKSSLATMNKLEEVTA